MDVEDGKENGDAVHAAEMEIGLLHFLHADDQAVGGGDDDGRHPAATTRSGSRKK